MQLAVAGADDAPAVGRFDCFGILFDVHDLFERFAKFRIEDGVDDGIDEAIHVAQPGGQDERGQTGIAVHAEFRAQCVEHVACEKRHPAHEEHTWGDWNAIKCQKTEWNVYW